MVLIRPLAVEQKRRKRQSLLPAPDEMVYTYTMHGRVLILGLMLFPLGCMETPDPPGPAPQPAAQSHFDSANTGAIHGRVLWDGDVPAAEPMTVRAIAFNPYLYKNPAICTQPHYPRVKDGGVAGAIVFLRGIDPTKARAWDHPPVRVEFQDRHMRIYQGQRETAAGMVRVGDDIEIVNRDKEFHLLRARGAAFFAAPLQTPNQPIRRTLAKPGLVDLTDGGGYLWLHGHLFVAAHPYFTETDAEGRFQLDQVPAGSYELICWMPSWIVKHRQRDPETGIMVRNVWADPVEQGRAVEVRRGEAADVDFCWSRRSFEHAAP